MTKTRIYITIALAAAAAVSVLDSCSIERAGEFGPGREISFRTFSDNMTRATPITSAADLSSIHVYAYDRSTPTELFFHDDFSRQADGSYQNASTAYYWPQGGTLDFLVYNELLGGTVEITHSKADLQSAIKGITVPTNAANQKDLLVARAEGSEQRDPNGVDLYLRHAFSQIKVQAKSSNANMKVEVVGVKLGGIKSTGDLYFPTSIVSSSSSSTVLGTDRWHNQGTPASFMYKVQDQIQTATTGKTLTASFEDVMNGQSFMLIPQQLTEWAGSSDPTNTSNGAYIAFLCRISQNSHYSSGGQDSYVQLFPSSADKFGFTATPISEEWQPGRTYTYQVEFFPGGNGGAGVTDPQPTDPTGGSNPGIDTGTGQGGQQIMGGTLKLSVTVDTWYNNQNIGTQL